MKAFALLLIFVGLIGSALGQDRRSHPQILAEASAAAAPAPALAPNSTLYSEALPPVRFQKDGIALVAFVAPGSIDEACGGDPMPFPFRRIACSGTNKAGVPMLIMPNPCLIPGEMFARIACHELGHRNGWPDTHGD